MNVPNQMLPRYIQPCLPLIDEHNVVSFDIFDTLLLRPVAVPCHLFWLMEKEVQELLCDPLFEFKQTRVEAESLARRYAVSQEDITLEQIYSAFGDITGIDSVIIESIKQKELALERQHCVSHPHSKALYDYAVASGKQVIFTSDMYLPESFVRELLKKNGFYIQEHPIFLSSELLKTKHNGTVYPYILTKLGCESSDILHIGDNKISDIKHAKRFKLSTFYIPRNTEQFFANKRNRQIWGGEEYIADIGTSLIIGHLAHYYGIEKSELLENTSEPMAANWYEFGYHIAGVLYLGFSQWLLKELKTKHIDKAFFLSRDGKIMRETFNLVASYYGREVDSSYLYASRRALQVARIKKIDTLALLYLATSKSDLPLGEYLARIGMDPDLYHEEMQKSGFSGKDHLIVSEDDKRKLCQFLRLIEPAILSHTEKERKNALGYYHGEGLNDNNKSHALIDVGWSGMMISALADILGKPPEEFPGFFLGTSPLGKKIVERGFPLQAYLFHLGEPSDCAMAAYQSFEVVELLFSAVHGSVKCFSKENGEYQPVFDEVDCNPERTAAIESLQKGALDFVKAVMPIMAQYPQVVIQPRLAMQPLYTLLMKPTKAEASMFCRITHVQDISATQNNKVIVQYPPSIFYLLFRPLSFVKLYQQVYWKRGFRSMMGGIPRAYFYLLGRGYATIQTNPLFFRFRRLLSRLVKV